MCATFANEVTVGSGRYARTYVRRRNELVVHFHGDAHDGDMLGIFVEPSDGQRHEHVFQLAPLWNARKVWALFNSVDDDLLRDHAQTLQANALIQAATPVYELDDGRGYATPMPGEMVVRIATGAVADVEAALAPGLARRREASALLPARDHLFTVLDAGHPDAGFDMLGDVRDTPDVLAAEHDWLELITYQAGYPADREPTDAAFVEGRHRNLEAIRMDVAAPLIDGAVGAFVWVIDSGFDLGHEDLDFPEPDASFLDAEALWNDDDPTQTDVLPRPNVEGETVPHGTCVSGIVGAVSDNAIGVTSVAGDCGIVPIRLAAAPTSGQLAVALGWAAARTDVARVVNLSLTAVPTMTLVNAVDAAVEAGLVLCAAAGNAFYGAEGVGFPARHARVLGVGAVGGDGRRYGADGTAGGEFWRSRFGNGLDVVAPGVGIPTTDEYAEPGWGWNPTDATRQNGGVGIRWLGVTHDHDGGDDEGKYFWVFSGTSSATPHVAGLASLLLAAHPDLSADAVRSIIIRTCRESGGHQPWGPCPFLSGAPRWNQEIGFGLIDVAAALANAPILAVVPPPEPIPDPDPCAIDDVVILEGWLGLGWGSRWRIYHSPALDAWTEVDEADILDQWAIPGAEGANRVVVRRGASLRQIRTAIERAETTARPVGR